MNKKRRRIIAVLLLVAIGNLFRINGFENIKMLHFVTILVIGILTGILIGSLIPKPNKSSAG